MVDKYGKFFGTLKMSDEESELLKNRIKERRKDIDKEFSGRSIKIENRLY